MAIQFEISESLGDALAVAIQVVVARAIRIQDSDAPWTVFASSIREDTQFILRITSPEGRDIFTLVYDTQYLPSDAELEASLDRGAYEAPDHPFWVKLEYDLFSEFISYSLRESLKRSEVGKDELQDLLSWVSWRKRSPFSHWLETSTGVLPTETVDLHTERSSDRFRFFFESEKEPSGSCECVTLPLFFCTNRTVSEKTSHLHNRYTVRRGSLSFGRVEVTIPLIHKLGNVERPKWWLLELRENSRKHVVLNSITELGVDEFTAELGSAMTDNQQILVFVHGYNATFTKAARQAAQLKYDLGFVGPVLMFSWASLGIPFGYPADEATAGWSVEHCEWLLKLLEGAPGTSAIHIVAHSMGSRIATAALERLSHPIAKSHGRIHQVVLAAPDIDADTLRQIAEAVRRSASRVTVYGSDSDWAIRASRLFHWAHRAGEGGTRMIIHDAMDSIDATEAGTGHLGHSYVTDSSSVLGDIHALIRSNPNPGERFGLRKTSLGAWEFVFRKHA